MKKIVAFTLLLCMVFALAACGNVEITLQEIYATARTETLLKNHENVYIRNEMDGAFWRETYLTKDYVYDYIPDEEFPWVQFMTNNACYHYDNGNTLLYLFVTPDGVGDFASKRAENYASVLSGEETLDQSIASVSENDGRITVTGVLTEENLADLAGEGVTGCKLAYVLDAETRELLSLIGDYTYDDGLVFHTTTEVTYDAEAPEAIEAFLGYVNQTENLRNVTIISNPGTEKEESKRIQAPKGLIIGFEYDDELGYVVAFYTDAACTESYDPYANTDSDLTIYVKWTLI